MPIRTNRGRAAVYRSLWGWPMRSPTHLVVTIVGFFALVVTIGVIVPRVLDPRPAAQTGVAATTSTQPNQVGVLPSSGQSNLPTKLPSPANSASAAPPETDAQLVAELWAETWIKPPANNDVNKWLEQLKPYTTDEFLAQMATIDPRNVPNKITEKVKPVKSTTSSIDFEVGTNIGKVRITLIKVQPDGKWRVNSYTKAD
ncbi:hypothetical protein Lesp02_80370 [Lentzea sp. NBRC 105346]|uniref:hypothetical protein n=1 Tax=Lentzea sp. NBRC 105346 TaxID=3032205 RepID=UPI0024A505B5|nr:hypothetical protein [Lentzea sp. NBRC 105346]GLZ35850.1 hypothetical protein Lesp02_80370 [Lentzea sp. NBRC 105346]